MLKIIFLIIVTLPYNSFAFNLNFSLYSSGLMAQKDEEGSRDTFSFHPKLSLSSVHPFTLNQFFSPELGIIKYVGLDDEYSKYTMFFLSNLIYKSSHQLLYKYGLGIFKTTISGKGGTITIRNGDDYATAYRPEESSTTYLASLNLGIELPKPRYSIGIDAFIFNSFSSLERSVSYSLNFNYFL